VHAGHENPRAYGSFRENVVLHPKATSRRIIVLDEATGNLGSLTIPIAQSKWSDNKG
jgi:hypothetical protein